MPIHLISFIKSVWRVEKLLIEKSDSFIVILRNSLINAKTIVRNLFKLHEFINNPPAHLRKANCLPEY